ncbi:hypothetical protein D8Y22_18435 [Salinadaptatus halalkaliphilus]|uniref:Uncharacterized protein n=1 Tax=Salinadaptatus halalkaliphilus TaxID=2419781 RepID=A0A4V3VKX5_9EURY|nr:hypothetical protein D8Y22_18435 [Salinadaptatus halalkaliphilus]
MTVNDPATLVSPIDLARTYQGEAYDDPWTAVEDYQRVLEYTGRNPNASAGKVAASLDLPRGRVRPWIDDDAIPHPVRGIQTAEGHGWIPLTEASDAFGPLNRLVAWTLTRGTIKADTYGPYYRVDGDDDRDRLEHLLDSLGVESMEHRTDDAHRSTERAIRDDGAVLGRLLTCLEAPTDDEQPTSVPTYLGTVSVERRRAFARTYLELRSEYWGFTDRWVIEHQNRTDAYRKSLAHFFSWLGADTEIHEDSISIDKEFVAGLGIEV